jgi:hypothetical protein
MLQTNGSQEKFCTFQIRLGYNPTLGLFSRNDFFSVPSFKKLPKLLLKRLILRID